MSAILQKMGLRKAPDPVEDAKQWQRKIKQEMRQADREIRELEREEKKAIAEVKKVSGRRSPGREKVPVLPPP
jgi:charged multivesicular body protein 3